MTGLLRKRPLYIFAKPKAVDLPTLVRYRAENGIGSTYEPDRFHSTLARLGETTAATIAAAHHALNSFRGEPFLVEFDRIEGNLLMGCKGLRAPGEFQRALLRHLALTGCPSIQRKFQLHMTLNYDDPKPDRRAVVPTVGWIVDEIFLTESVHGERRHECHGRWQLIRRQGVLLF